MGDKLCFATAMRRRLTVKEFDTPKELEAYCFNDMPAETYADVQRLFKAETLFCDGDVEGLVAFLLENSGERYGGIGMDESTLFAWFMQVFLYRQKPKFLEEAKGCAMDDFVCNGVQVMAARREALALEGVARQSSGTPAKSRRI